MPRVLLVEDESSIADSVRYALGTEGFEVLWVKLAGEVPAALDLGNIDFLILDVGLPDGNGFDLLRDLQGRQGLPPVLMLTARSEEIDRVVGLELGADDYVVKPFSPRELCARVRAILRRTRQPGQTGSPAGAAIGTESVACGAFAVDRTLRRIHFGGLALELTRNEYQLLLYLVEHPRRVFSRSELMEAVWEEPMSAMERTVDSHIKSLRAKLRDVAPEADPLKTSRGQGYYLDPES